MARKKKNEFYSVLDAFDNAEKATSRIDKIHTAMKQNAIAGHEQAIAKLKASIAQREHNLKSVRYLAPPVRIAFNRMHLAEIHQLEILELELRGIENGLTH